MTAVIVAVVRNTKSATAFEKEAARLEKQTVSATVLGFEQEKGTGCFSSGFLGLPRFRIVDSKPSVAAIFACESSL